MPRDALISEGFKILSEEEINPQMPSCFTTVAISLSLLIRGTYFPSEIEQVIAEMIK